MNRHLQQNVHLQELEQLVYYEVDYYDNDFEMTELIEAAEGIIDNFEASDDEEHWSNIVEDWIETLDLENHLENG
ncbi:5434_t:CDS:2 [Racocetra fulgida]|uniref:5434_t:CDS:1 n=1 Tax=Racocetra fulgida TaxID=60492 RepID=A0A9N8ZDH8_9GLOM|nr:5434_t:CDS:2 [Racocetra fulgida]